MNWENTGEDVFLEEGETSTGLTVFFPEIKNASASDTVLEMEAGIVTGTSDVSEYDTDFEELSLKYYFPGDIPAKNGFQEFSATPSGDKCFADESEDNSTSPTSNSDVDSGLPRNDFLDFEKCALCGTKKKDTSYPYCSSCFTFKKSLNLERPKKKKKYLKGISSLLEVSKPTANNFSSSENSKICRVCLSGPEAGLFIHAKSAHLYGCYKCAKKIWCEIGCCPMCRTKVKKVTKLLIS